MDGCDGDGSRGWETIGAERGGVGNSSSEHLGWVERSAWGFTFDGRGFSGGSGLGRLRRSGKGSQFSPRVYRDGNMELGSHCREGGST